ncbi:uncharacterized protein LOC110696801 [Chenopodium quinoa]|uniref:uncharacterized protein LOC110696801 n=1 Tax=Chenopodium quinoa TaxID=63459 RepID=UPI000B797C11|nr:uncharacterized protein LOC110696801 [Chenopodium quinoa]
MLVKCGDAKLIWYISPLRLDILKFGGETFREWCNSVIETYKDVAWWNIFWSIAWGVWLKCNRWCFEGKRWKSNEVIRRAVSMVGEFETVQEISNTNPSSPTLDSSWKPPMEGVIKVNSDAAVFAPSGVGLGGVMRDSVGDVVASTCLKLERKFEVDVVEALAMRHALNIVIDFRFRNVCLETDCLKLHNHLVKSITPSTAFGAIVKDFLQLSTVCHLVSFSFVRRSGNRVAHNLAKLCLSFNELRVFMEDFPSDVIEFVVADLSPDV